MPEMSGKTAFITGASRGIGKAIALRLAREGCNITIAAKTVEPHPKLAGTIFTAAKKIEEAGGVCLPLKVDVRSEEDVAMAMDATVKRFGGIDILVNNAGVIHLAATVDTTMKKFDLLQSVNTRGAFVVSKYAIPHLQRAPNAHILNIGPPLTLKPDFFATSPGYTLAKYGMSMCVLGMAEELRSRGVAVNALWPKSIIWTAAANLHGGPEFRKQCRKPDIMADAAFRIFQKDAKVFSGHFLIDEEFLRDEGETDFEKYAEVPGEPLVADFFLPDDVELGPEFITRANL